MYQHLLSPLTLRGTTLKNRVILAPTTMGLPPEERAERLLSIARGGTALLILGDMAVEPTFHKSGCDLTCEEGVAECVSLVERLHACGAKVSAQLFSPDYDTEGFLRLRDDPATTREELNQFIHGNVDRYITDMSAERVEELIALFGQRAATAKEAGFDMIQIHGDRLLGAFSSTNYNRREDGFGGDAAGRAQFACRVVASVRAAVGEDMPIDYKLAVRQPALGVGKSGPTPEELEVFVPMLEAAGVDTFHVTGANHSNLEDAVPPAAHPTLQGEGCFLPLADQVRRYTQCPICGVGKLQSPDYIDEAIASGRIQLVAMSRQLLADPEWVNKASEGNAEGIRKCVYCNRRCVNNLRNHLPFGCIFDGN